MPSPKQQAKAYDRERGTQRDRGYTRRWEKARLAFLREHPLCLGCDAIGQVKAAEIVDHVEPHKGDMIKFWNMEMWQSVCRWHHEAIKKQLEMLYERGSLTLADLWLNSEAAIKLTRQHQAKPIGVDGWPIDPPRGWQNSGVSGAVTVGGLQIRDSEIE